MGLGIDMNSWNTGDKFMGVKMIPPGIHFVYYSAVDMKEKRTSPRSGFFHNFGRGELLARRWDPLLEDMVDDISIEDVGRLKSDLFNIDKYLGCYPYPSWSKWVSLSNRLSPASLLRLEPLQTKIRSVPELVPGQGDTIQQEEASSCESKLPNLISKPGTGIRYTWSLAEDKKSSMFPEGSDAKDITKHSMDSSYKLSKILEKFSTLYTDSVSGGSMAHENICKEFLADIQFSFLCFLVGQNYDSFEQWKHLVALMCRCDSALVEHKTLFSDFLSDLYFQMKEVPQDFFVDIVSQNNFLYSSLNILFNNIRESNEVDQDLKIKASRFEKNLSKRFSWDFSQESAEDAPVIVQL